MSPRLALALAAALFLAALAASAATIDHDLRSAVNPRLLSNPGGRLVGGVVTPGKADADTVYLVGGPDRLDGRFETASGQPSWHGWTHEDASGWPCMWQVSDFQAINGALSAWCGTYYDDDPGYGNLWDIQLIFSHHVADPSVATTVHWTLLLQNDTEVGYDYTRFAARLGGEWEELRAVSGNQFVTVDETVIYEPGDYGGSAGDEIQLRIQVTSDSAWSDQDGLIDTNGACQIDDIEVSVDGAVVSFEDCEDGVLDDWECYTPAVGDYAALWVGLEDLDSCRENDSAQVAFIDDGVVVPGTGGTSCITWCYGPNGYIVNNTGGLAGPPYGLYNQLVSPVLDLPAGTTGVAVMLDAYVHEELGSFSVWPGVFYAFEVRSTVDPVNEPIEQKPWRWPGDLWYGGPAYTRNHQDLTSLIAAGSAQVQVSITALDWATWHGVDGTPAPYIDNVAIVAYAAGGPYLETVDWDQAQDAFPEAGDLDFADLAANSVRFDAARGTDYLPYRAKAVRAGSTLLGPPALQVRMRPNPLFDGVRQLPEGFVHEAGLILGAVLGDSVYNNDDPPELIPDRYRFDLPDTGFFFPGDVIHYYVEAQDDLAGDVGVSRIPADTTGLTDFSPVSPYGLHFRVRALPTLRSATPGDQPPILYYADDMYTQSRWHHALQWLGYHPGEDYDCFVTKASASDQPNSLGHQATSALLAGYETLVSSSGGLNFALVTEDVLLLDNWFDRGGKHALLTGDELVRSLAVGDAFQRAFLNNHLGVDYLADDLANLVGGQVAPTVRAEPNNGFIAQVDEWTAYAGCPFRPTLDAIEAVGSTVRLAQYLDPSGNGGVYPLAAATYHLDEPSGAEVVVLPYDLVRATAAPGWEPPAGMQGIAPRALILEDILAAFGHLAPNEPIAAPDALPFTVQVAPNPFNPRTSIDFTLPRAGEVRVELYDLRGARVRTLVDEPRPAGRHTVIWDGASDTGGPVASGVYFCQVRAAGERRVQKLTLVR